MNLLGFEFAEVQAVRPVHQIHRRQYQQRRLPPDMAVQEVHQAGRGCANHVVRKEPHMALAPHASDGFVSGRLSSRIPSCVKMKLTESVPSMPGSPTFNDDASNAAIR